MTNTILDEFAAPRQGQVVWKFPYVKYYYPLRALVYESPQQTKLMLTTHIEPEDPPKKMMHFWHCGTGHATNSLQSPNAPLPHLRSNQDDLNTKHNI